MRNSLFVLLLVFISSQVSAQLDTIHWVPPVHARVEYGPQFLYISTPSPLPFPVEIRDGQGNVLQTLTISNSSPMRYDIGTTASTRVLVLESELHKALNDKGLVLVGEKKFYVNFRARSNSLYQACDLTCKGQSALGKTFRIGHVLQAASSSDSRCNFIGIMATEDSTIVRLTDFDANVRFRINLADVQLPTPVTLLLNAGESCVFSNYINSNATYQPPNGLMGSLLTSNKPIAVNTGSWLAAPVTAGANDIGIDQIVPVELVGEEYILCKGNGSSILETPIVVAHENGTEVRVNGNPTPLATLNAGDFYVIPTIQYTAVGNMYIETTKPAYIYQMVGGVPSGDDAPRTVGLIFVPPVSCGIPNAVDNIYQPNFIGDYAYDGGLMVVAMRDSQVTVRMDGNIVSLGTPGTVLGNPDFVTYRNLSLFPSNNPPTTVSIVAEGAVQVAYFGRNGAAGFGGFYSGFSESIKPNISLSIVGDGVCPDTLVATGLFDGVQWYYADSLLQYGPDSFFIAYAPGDYIARGYLGVCRKTGYVQDTVVASFNSPEFPYTITDPHCFGESTGVINFGEPFGGIEPYQYSVNNGASFSTAPNAGNIAAGAYKLVVKDATGCYNRPLDVLVNQPDSLGVTATLDYTTDPVKPGDLVHLSAEPGREIVSAAWTPSDSLSCPDCLRTSAYPTRLIWYEITVTDSEGCTATDRVQAVVQPNVYVPNVFSPDSGDGNDIFLLFSEEALPVSYLRIYDRWGALVFLSTNFFTNDPAGGWNGKSFNSKEKLPPAVYVFTAELEYLPGKKIFLKGDITLIR